MTAVQAAVASLPPGGVCPGGELLQYVGCQTQGRTAQTYTNCVRLGGLKTRAIGAITIYHSN